MAYEIREGRQFRIGRIDITGNEVTKDKVVRRVLDEYDFTPGELYDAEMAPREGNGRLEKYVQRAAGAQQVMIRPVAPEDGDPNRKDVRVDMEEGMTGMIRPGVGFSSDSAYQEQTVALKSGDVVCAFTDGVFEAQNQAGEEFGEQAIADCLRAHRRLGARELGDALYRKIKSFIGTGKFRDDFTILIVKVR